MVFFYKCQETKKPKQRRKRSNKQTNNQTSNQQPTTKQQTNIQLTKTAKMCTLTVVTVIVTHTWSSSILSSSELLTLQVLDIHQNVETFSRCVLISADFRSISLCGLWLGHTLASSSAQIPHVLFQGQSVSPTERSRQPRIKRSSGSLAIC